MRYRKPRKMTEKQGRRLYKHLGRILAKKAEGGEGFGPCRWAPQDRAKTGPNVLPEPGVADE